MGEISVRLYKAPDMRSLGSHIRINASNALFNLLGLVCCLCLILSVHGQNVDKTWKDSLSQVLVSGTVEEKRSALYEIRIRDSEEASLLAIPALSDPEDMVRATAVAAIIRLPASDAVSLISPLLEDLSEFVRQESAYALGSLGSPLSEDKLLLTLKNDKALSVRTAATISIGKAGNMEAVDHLTRLLSRRGDDEAFLRRSASRSIGQIIQRAKNKCLNDPMSPCRASLGNEQEVPASRPVYTERGIPDTERVLIQVLQNKNEDPDTRREAAYALGVIGGQYVVKVLRSHVGNADPYLAEICSKALQSMDQNN